MSFWLQNASQPRRLPGGLRDLQHLQSHRPRCWKTGERAQTHRQEPFAFWLRGRLDKLINLCLLPLALFLDVQTLPSSKARGIRMSRQDKQSVAPPGPEAWPDAGTCARALQGPAPRPGVCGWSRCLPRRGPPQGQASARPQAGDSQLPWGLGGTTTHLGPLLRAEGGARLPELWHQLSFQPASLPRPSFTWQVLSSRNH